MMILKNFKKRAGVLKRSLKREAAGYFHLGKMHLSTFMPENKTSHGLNAPLYITLTSYPPRFRSLYPTLLSLLRQTVEVDAVILWVTEEDYSRLPEKVIRLRSRGLIINKTSDLGSYKKLIPALEMYKNAYLVTADDDLVYRPSWLASMLSEHDSSNERVICKRAHRIVLDPVTSMPLPYSKWEHEISGPCECDLVFPTSGGGMIFPPNLFVPEILKSDSFLRLAPNADDVWIYFMIRISGIKVLKTEGHDELAYWPDTYDTALEHLNVGGGGNDEKVSSMIGAYGWPPMIDFVQRSGK